MNTRKFWKIVETKHGKIMLPQKELTCPICRSKLIIHNFVATFTIQHQFYHCDVHCKCINCSYYCVFGVPITKEESEELKKSELHSKVLKDELLDIYRDEDKEEIEKRLKRFGYW